MRLALTGSTGFLGGAVARALADAGHHVRGLVRDPARWSDRPAGAEVAVADLRDAGAVEAALAGCEAVVHVAALVKLWVPDPAQYDAVNVAAFASLAEACRTRELPLIYVSSFFALGSTEGTVVDESRRRPDEPTFTEYVRTKTEADRLAAGWIERQPIVRVYPGVVFGPGAWTEGNHVLRTLAQHAEGKLPGLLGRGDRRQCFAYVEDVARGLVQAVERMPVGGRFILGGENRTVVELFEAFERETGIRPPRVKIPYGVARWVGRFQRWRAERFGVEPELTDDVVALYRREWAFSSDKAVRELGYAITPFQDAIGKSVAWMRETGRLPPGTRA